MSLYRVILGVDRAAKDTGRRITMVVRERDTLSAAIRAEDLADAKLDDPSVEYTHAMRVKPVIRPTAVAAVSMAA